MPTNSKMASQMNSHFRESLEHFVRLLESCEKVMCWPVHCLVYNAADSCENHHERVTQFWTSSSEEDVEKRKINILILKDWHFYIFSHHSGSLFVMKTLQNERYILKACRF